MIVSAMFPLSRALSAIGNSSIALIHSLVFRSFVVVFLYEVLETCNRQRALSTPQLRLQNMGKGLKKHERAHIAAPDMDWPHSQVLCSLKWV